MSEEKINKEDILGIDLYQNNFFPKIIDRSSIMPESEEINTIQITGNLTINEITNIKKEILDEYSENTNLKIVLKDIKNVDFSFIQLIISLGKTLQKQNKTLTIDKNKIENAISLSGFSNILNNVQFI